MRPIAEMAPPEEVDRVKCWNCGEQVDVHRNAARVECPHCGRAVAMHRLKLPSMPSTKVSLASEGGDVVVLRADVGVGERADGPTLADPGRLDARRMPILENGEPESILQQGGEAEFASPERLPFEARKRVEEKREELFGEAEPRMDPVGRMPEIDRGSMKLLAVSLAVFVALTFAAVVMALQGKERAGEGSGESGTSAAESR